MTPPIHLSMMNISLAQSRPQDANRPMLRPSPQGLESGQRPRSEIRRVMAPSSLPIGASSQGASPERHCPPGILEIRKRFLLQREGSRRPGFWPRSWL